MQLVPFTNAHSADLWVDAVYQGGRTGNAGDDPLPHLVRVSNSGGFRYRGQVDELDLVVLTSSGKDPDWPDMLDPETGVYTYFGDNKSAGPLHETPRKGNELLRRIFDLAHSGLDGRRQVPPIFLFENTGEWRDVRFLGLAVPGTADLRASEDLVAIWRISKGSRFQNYRARFSVLNTPTLSRAWIEDIIAGNPHSSNAPEAWSTWVRTGQPRSLFATRSLEYRTKDEQIPRQSRDLAILKRVHEYFRENFHAFERCAAKFSRLLLPDIADIDLTRPSRDGGRDGIGRLRVGSGPSSILVDFALEAKCYNVSAGVGVKDMSRLISRLRHRQFGILVTTSYVNVQAYREIKEDQHPIIVIAGVDIVMLLRNDGYADPGSVQTWLEQNFVLEK
ncbi:MAG: restriction endonuclease [Deltaproteobacteria bacterium]|nr:restriction endonuclease [Deltaproteobacteria bacterium]